MMAPPRHWLALGVLLGGSIACAQEPAPAAFASDPRELPAPAGPKAPKAVTLDDLVGVALARNPRLAKATLAIEAAQGRRLQAGLYPNPVFAVTGDELGDKTGPGGIWTAPQFNQEIVTGGKLSLSQAVAAKEVDQVTLALLGERYALMAAVRSAFYDAYTLQRRTDLLHDLTDLARQSVANGKKLLDGGQLARLDFVQLEIEAERLTADLEAAERELPPAYRRLAAVAGDTGLAIPALDASFDTPLPAYDLDRDRAILAASHPEIISAKVGVEKSQLTLDRARAEVVPNLTVSGAYVRQNQNKSSDWMVGVSVPLPTWNRNQGNIIAAQAGIGSAGYEVRRTENALADQLAAAHRTYASAKRRAERYAQSIIPKTEETFRLSTEAFKGGQFEYLRVLQSQRALAESRLEYVRAAGEAWKAAGEISGLLLEETWPPRPAVKR